MTTGLMDSTVMLSYEHMVLVNELVDQYKQIHINTDIEHIARDVIEAQTPPDYDFLSSDHTLRFMKDAVHYSDFAGRTARPDGDWYEIAHEKVKEIFASPPEDDEESRIVDDRLAAVVARVKEDDVSWREGDDCWWESYLQDI